MYVGGRHLATYSGTTTYFHNADWLGTERVRTDVNGNIYETCQGLPYGDGQACSGTEVTPMHHTGKHRDTETNLDDFPARYYSSVQGRWLSPDWDDKPVAVPYAILGNPQTLNLYSYVGGDPTNHADPDGHIYLCPTCATSADSSSEAQNQGSGQPGDKAQNTVTAATVGAVIGGVGGAIVGGIAGAAGGTLVEPGGGTIVGGGLGGVEGAKDGAALGALIGATLGIIYSEAKDAVTGPKAADAPGVTAGGQATDAHGNKLGPSGETQIDRTRSNTREGARNRALGEGSGAVEHSNPRVGSRHWHPTDAQGNKKPSSTHHEYPDE